MGTCKKRSGPRVGRDFVKAATLEGHEREQPSVIFPILQKTTVNLHMSAPRLLLKRKLPGNRQAAPVIRLLAENGNIKSAALLVTSRQPRGLNTRPPESGDEEEALECLSTVEVPLSKAPEAGDSSVTSPSVVACALCVILCNFPSGRLILLL